MPARPSGSRPRTRASSSNWEDATEPNKGKSHAAKGKQPYPTSRPVREAARLKKGPSTSSESSGTDDRSPDQRTLLTLTLPPRMTKTASSSSSSSSSSSGKSERTFRDLGLPTRNETAALEEQYLASLDPRKRAKALISQALFDNIWMALHRPRDNTIGSPQFRWWVRKMFTLARPDGFGGFTPYVVDRDSDHDFDLDTEDDVGRGGEGGRDGMTSNLAEYQPQGETGLWGVPGVVQPKDAMARTVLPVVLHDGKRVAIREQIHDILSACHARVLHGGRDKTATEIRKNYTWVPKDLIALFVKNCPTCLFKKARLGPAERDGDRSAGVGPSAVPVPVPGALPAAMSCDPSALGGVSSATALALAAQYAPLSLTNLGPQAAFGVSELAQFAWPPPAQPALAPLAPGPDALAANGFSQANATSAWCFPPGPVAPGPDCFFLQNGMYAAPHALPRLDGVQLPSIHVADAHSGGLAGPHAQVTLPSLSQVLSAELTTAAAAAAGREPPYVRQPLHALYGNVDPSPPGQNYSQPAAGASYPSDRPQVPYAPVIDPALLAQDGVQMLAMAAEVAQRGR